MKFLNQNLNLEELKKNYIENSPNHVVLQDLFDSDFIKICEKEFLDLSDEDFFKYSDPYFEFEKYTLNNLDKMPENLKRLFIYIHSDEFVSFIQKITGLENLKVDEKRWGGGLHKTKHGGYLSIHKDFNVLPDSYLNTKQLLRCINVIGYLTDEDQEFNNGSLEFWKDGKITKLLNQFNSWVIFDTRNNFHGQPFPFKGKKPRMSIASYYYIEEKIDSQIWKSTDYLKLPWMEESTEYEKARAIRSNPKIRYSKIYNFKD